MSSIHHRAARTTSRNVPTDTDIVLWRLGNTHGLTPEDVAAIIRTAELAGCWTAVERIQDHHRRRALVREAPAASPRPGPKPKPTPPQSSILFLVEGSDERATPEEMRCEHFLRTARLAEQGARAGWATPIEAAALLDSAARCRAVARAD